jgi:hypothetical protein
MIHLRTFMKECRFFSCKYYKWNGTNGTFSAGWNQGLGRQLPNRDQLYLLRGPVRVLALSWSSLVVFAADLNTNIARPDTDWIEGSHLNR